MIIKHLVLSSWLFQGSDCQFLPVTLNIYSFCAKNPIVARQLETVTLKQKGVAKSILDCYESTT